jgi:hypothetical protein
LEPASLFVEGWTQRDYHSLWIRVIERFAASVIVMPGWEYSVGSVIEFYAAIARLIPVKTLNNNLVDVERGVALIERAAGEFHEHGISAEKLEGVLDDLRSFREGMGSEARG